MYLKVVLARTVGVKYILWLQLAILVRGIEIIVYMDMHRLINQLSAG